MAGFEVQPQNVVIGVGFRWLARFLDPPPPPISRKKFFHATLVVWVPINRFITIRVWLRPRVMSIFAIFILGFNINSL